MPTKPAPNGHKPGSNGSKPVPTAVAEAVAEGDPGDFLVLYTDGITDALNPGGQDFGMHNLEGVILEQRENSAAEIAAALERALEEHLAGTSQFDDITLMIARRKL